MKQKSFSTCTISSRNQKQVFDVDVSFEVGQKHFISVVLALRDYDLWEKRVKKGLERKSFRHRVDARVRDLKTMNFHYVSNCRYSHTLRDTAESDECDTQSERETIIPIGGHKNA